MAESGRGLGMARPRNFAIAERVGTRYSSDNAVLT
jgi:hypothetical protein